MMESHEKRREKRFNVQFNLEISSLFRQDNVCVENITEPIHVINISRGGIGFYSRSVLPVDYYFNSCIQLYEGEEKIYCVVKIIRKEQLENGECLYGCEFVGLAPVLYYIFDEFEKLENK